MDPLKKDSVEIEKRDWESPSIRDWDIKEVTQSSLPGGAWDGTTYS